MNLFTCVPFISIINGSEKVTSKFNYLLQPKYHVHQYLNFTVYWLHVIVHAVKDIVTSYFRLENPHARLNYMSKVNRCIILNSEPSDLQSIFLQLCYSSFLWSHLITLFLKLIFGWLDWLDIFLQLRTKIV